MAREQSPGTCDKCSHHLDTTSSTTASTTQCMPTVIRAVTPLSPVCGTSRPEHRMLIMASSLHSLSPILSSVLRGAASPLQQLHAVHIARSRSIQFELQATSSHTRLAPRRVGVGNSLGADSTALSLMSVLCMTVGRRPKRPNKTMQPTTGRRTVSLSMTKTRSFQANLDSASGGDLCSR